MCLYCLSKVFSNESKVSNIIVYVVFQDQRAATSSFTIYRKNLAIMSSCRCFFHLVQSSPPRSSWTEPPTRANVSVRLHFRYGSHVKDQKRIKIKRPIPKNPVYIHSSNTRSIQIPCTVLSVKPQTRALLKAPESEPEALSEAKRPIMDQHLFSLQGETFPKPQLIAAPVSWGNLIRYKFVK